MYKNIVVAIDLNDETSGRNPLLAAVELARKFRAQLHVLTVVRELEAILQAKTSPLAYELIAGDLEHQLARLIRKVGASNLHPKILGSRREHLCRDPRHLRGSGGRSDRCGLAPAGDEGLSARHECIAGDAPRPLLGPGRAGGQSIPTRDMTLGRARLRRG